MPLILHVTTQSENWKEFDDIKAQIKNVASICLKKFKLPENCRIHIDATLCDDDEICKINQVYRAKNKPTDVLSFPQYENLEDWPDHQDILLGDIILSYSTIMKTAKEQKKTFKDHLTHLVVHSTLHLLGFDHKEEDDAKNMEELEISILAELGIQNPYRVGTSQ